MKTYLITDPSYYNTKEQFRTYLIKIYQNNTIDYSCFRDKKNHNFIEYAKLFLEISKEFGIEKTILNTHIKIAKDLGFFGVHLTSTQFNKIQEAKEKNLFTVVSTHSFEDIKQVKDEVDAITFSPIFPTPNKGKPKGVDELKKAVVLASSIKCFALGGIITKKHIKECENSGAYGFASIRYFSVK